MAKEISIGDEVWVHGYVDEIRKDCIIIRNDGGYFGTAKGEVVTADIPQPNCDKCIWSVCNYNKVDWDADTLQTDCEACELDGKADVCKICRSSIYEPQTDCAWK